MCRMASCTKLLHRDIINNENDSKKRWIKNYHQFKSFQNSIMQRHISKKPKNDSMKKKKCNRLQVAKLALRTQNDANHIISNINSLSLANTFRN